MILIFFRNSSKKFVDCERAIARRSQAALEFIMTYGWAIMVVIVAIAALAYFGVLNPDRFLPSKCTLPAGIACLDHLASGSAILVTLKNSLGYDITSVTVRASGCTTADSQAKFRNEEQREFTPSGCSLTNGQKYNGQINVSYTNTDTGISHTAQGTITTRVE